MKGLCVQPLEFSNDMLLMFSYLFPSTVPLYLWIDGTGSIFILHRHISQSWQKSHNRNRELNGWYYTLCNRCHFSGAILQVFLFCRKLLSPCVQIHPTLPLSILLLPSSVLRIPGSKSFSCMWKTSADLRWITQNLWREEPERRLSEVPEKETILHPTQSPSQSFGFPKDYSHTESRWFFS